MKVKDLIRELEKYNPDSGVKTEGCDCYGEIDKSEEINNIVYLYRPK